MRLKITLFVVSLLAVCATADAAECAADKLVGTWKVVKATFNDQDNITPSVQQVKLITPSHFTWVHYDRTSGKADAAAGGTYTVSGPSYVETIEFAFGPDAGVLLKRQFNFSCSMDGNTWTIKGQVLLTRIEETWERVTAKE
jgi:hypothetical protein